MPRIRLPGVRSILVLRASRMLTCAVPVFYAVWYGNSHTSFPSQVAKDSFMSTPVISEPRKKHTPYVPETMEMKEFAFRALLIGLVMTAVLGSANAYLGLKAGMTVTSGPTAEPKVGNCLPLANIPGGLEVHNIEMNPGQGGKLVRTAGGVARPRVRPALHRRGDQAPARLAARAQGRSSRPGLQRRHRRRPRVAEPCDGGGAAGGRREDRSVAVMDGWRAGRESNPQPSDPKSDALSS